MRSRQFVCGWQRVKRGGRRQSGQQQLRSAWELLLRAAAGAAAKCAARELDGREHQLGRSQF